MLISVFLLLGCGPATPGGEVGPTPTNPSSIVPTEVQPTRTSATAPMPSPTLAPTVQSTATPGMPAEARAYLDQALDILQQHSINRSEIDWDRLRPRVYGRAENALSPADTYPAIEFALRSLGDAHSFFLTPEQVAELQSGTLNAHNPEPTGRLLENGLAYVMLPSFAGSTEAGEAYAKTLQGIIRELDSTRPCGWIVDLRENGGGDFWPMLAGIGPVLGEGPAGAFVTPEGQLTSWSYASGQALEGSTVQIEVGKEATYHLQGPLPPVAVLTGRQTLSSGEALLVSFCGRADTRSFGLETGGLSTGNERFALSDGANIYLTVSRFADRTGEVYGGILSPDEYLSGADSNPDLAVEAAAAWLLEQPRCAGSP